MFFEVKEQRREAGATANQMLTCWSMQRVHLTNSDAELLLRERVVLLR